MRKKCEFLLESPHKNSLRLNEMIWRMVENYRNWSYLNRKCFSWNDIRKKGMRFWPWWRIRQWSKIISFDIANSREMFLIHKYFWHIRYKSWTNTLQEQIKMQLVTNIWKVLKNIIPNCSVNVKLVFPLVYFSYRFKSEHILIDLNLFFNMNSLNADTGRLARICPDNFL